MRPPTVAPGTILGTYRIVSPLSAGGMGSVFIAEHTQTGRRRALKLMHPDLVADPKLRRRFELEAKVAGRIESDHVVEVIDAGVDAGSGTPWLAMELLDGEELRKVIARRGALPREEVHEIFTQLCHALGAAHAQGIVHRDLKPENLYMAKARRPGVPFTLKVLDFGIAKIVAEAKTTATDTIGSPLWMAPEQAQRGAGITPATDVWALGLIAFRLLTGKLYWLSALDPNRSQMMMLKEVVMDPLAPASDRASALGVVDRLPAGFDAWFARCVTRSLPERFPTAREAWDALEPLLAPAPLAATVPAAPQAALFAAAGQGTPPPAEATAPMSSSTTSAPTLNAARAAPNRARRAARRCGGRGRGGRVVAPLAARRRVERACLDRLDDRRAGAVHGALTLAHA